MVGGNPAKLIKYRFSDEMIKEFLKLKWWNWPINRIMEYSALFETPKEFLRVAFEIDETGVRKND